MELYYKLISKVFKEKAFKIHAVLFNIFLLLRLAMCLILGFTDYNSLIIDFSLRVIFIIILLVPALYTFYSLIRYFSFTRAAGYDHFNTAAYKDDFIVKKGMFKYSKNAIYKYGALIIWALAFIFASKALLINGLFCHLLIWVHYYTTEKPDMDYIYKKKKDLSDSEK